MGGVSGLDNFVKVAKTKHAEPDKVVSALDSYIGDRPLDTKELQKLTYVFGHNVSDSQGNLVSDTNELLRRISERSKLGAAALRAKMGLAHA